jgi:hypothetical protein
MIFGSVYRPMRLVMMKYLISQKKLYYSIALYTVKWLRMIFGSVYRPLRLVMMKYLISRKKLYYSNLNYSIMASYDFWLRL